MRNERSRSRWQSTHLLRIASTCLLAIFLTSCAAHPPKRVPPQPQEKAPSKVNLLATPVPSDRVKVLGDYVSVALAMKAALLSCNIDKAAAFLEVTSKDADAKPAGK
jgi:hypothetical protein